jgi:hypothetical protein
LEVWVMSEDDDSEAERIDRKLGRLFILMEVRI